MGAASNLAELAKSLDRKWWPDHRVEMGPEVAALLKEHKLVIADVGAAGGPEEIWLSLQEYIHFVSFDPNPHADPERQDYQTTNFPIGLWSTAGERELHLTGHPDSSSVLPINTALFSDFLTKGGMEMVSKTSIRLDTLDNVLAGKPGLSPDYLKVDVEGGDLEVLKGATKALQESIMGSRIETAFLELQIGRALLWEVDEFMRGQGFVLFNFGRNYWVRNNGLHGYTSQPQLAWGDAIYFLGREGLLQRLGRAGDVAKRKEILAKFVVMLLRYGVHDYTWDVIQDAKKAGLVPAEFCDALGNSVKQSMDTSVWYFIKSGLGVMFALMIFVVSLPFAGPRTRSIYYIKQRLGRFCHDLWRRTALGGRVRHACVGDPFV